AGHHDTPERLEELHVGPVAVGDAHAEIDDRFLAAVGLRDPRARERDEPAALVPEHRRIPPDGLDVGRPERTVLADVVRAIERLELDRPPAAHPGWERVAPAGEMRGREFLFLVELLLNH